ncbi:hypothetical protein JCM18237_30340 [Halorubrum luteum]
MPTRRQTIIGLTSAAAGGAVLSAGAFTSSVSAGADMRVVVVSDLRLEPAREDNQYVNVEDDEIEIVIEKLNQRAFTDFGQLVRIVNEGNVGYDRLTFEFSVLDDSGPEAASVMGVVSEGTDVAEDDDTFVIEPEGGLGPGESITFGVTVNFLPSRDAELTDFPDSEAELELNIIAERLE